MKTKQSAGKDATVKLIESIAVFKDLYLDHPHAN
jgi:hypothetical protein